jgi:hypothetical protein
MYLCNPRCLFLWAGTFVTSRHLLTRKLAPRSRWTNRVAIYVSLRACSQSLSGQRPTLSKGRTLPGLEMAANRELMSGRVRLMQLRPDEPAARRLR